MVLWEGRPIVARGERARKHGFFHVRASEQTAGACLATLGHLMQDLLQRLDVDYYRVALLLVARAELERLRQKRADSDETPMHVDRDLELDFIREFATGGELLKGLSSDGRRDRIRVAIYTQQLAHKPFRDGPMTYAEAYAECFGRPLEMRATVRPEPKIAGPEATT